MNTRLLMTLRVTIATPQSIGAVPHGTRRTVPITGGDFEGPATSRICVTWWKRRLAPPSSGWSSRAGPSRHAADRRRRTHFDEVVRLASRSARRDRGPGTWRGGRSGSLLFSDDAAVRNRTPSTRILEPSHHGGERRPTQ